MSYIARPPTIPSSGNFKSATINTLNVDNINGGLINGSSIEISGSATIGNSVIGGNQLGFFGDSVVQQNTDGTLNNLISILQSYGLIKEWPVQQGSKLIGSGAIDPANQGSSVSLSEDGNTLAFGGKEDDSGIGATWIFTRSGTTWTQQGSKLVGTGAVGASKQGCIVSLSGDGNTLAFGGKEDDSGIGATWIFTRSGTTWSQQGSKLVGTGATGAAYQGSGISLSRDGNTLAIGGTEDDSLAGAVWIFTRSGTTWTQQGSKLVGTGAVNPAYQGYTVSLSEDGNTLAVSGPEDDSGIGGVWIFIRTSGVWTQQESKLVGTGAVDPAYQGYGISLSDDGNTLAIGGFGDDSNVGATWIFTRSGTTWTQQGSKLVGSGAVGTAQQGYSVSLNSDGDKLIISGGTDNSDVGATWMFSLVDDEWTQQGPKMVGSGAVGASGQGSTEQSISISGDGTTIAVGGANDDTAIGATWIFTV